MVGGQLQVDSVHIQENSFGETSVVLTRLFILFVSKTGNLQKVCGRYSKTFNHKIFYSDKYLMSYAQDGGYTSQVSLFLFDFNHVLYANNISYFSSCCILYRQTW